MSLDFSRFENSTMVCFFPVDRRITIDLEFVIIEILYMCIFSLLGGLLKITSLDFSRFENSTMVCFFPVDRSVRMDLELVIYEFLFM